MMVELQRMGVTEYPRHKKDWRLIQGANPFLQQAAKWSKKEVLYLCIHYAVLHSKTQFWPSPC